VYKLYLAKLKRTNNAPRCVYKVGITKSSDAMRRLLYRGADELYPIVDTFPDIKVMKSVWLETENEALTLESNIMEQIAGKGNKFHNWYEPKQLSGITEMRTWNYDEFLQIIKIMDDYNNEKATKNSVSR
jgi:hypothetical protein